MENLVVSTKKKITLDKIMSQVKIVTNAEIKNVLMTNAKVCVLSSECTNGVVSIAGKVCVNIVYLSAENTIESAEAVSDFVEKQRTDANLSDLFVQNEIIIDSINFSSNEAICLVSTIPTIYGVYKYEMPIIENDENNLVINSSSFEASKLIASPQDNFVVAEEVESNITGVVVLDSSANAVINDVSCTVDKIVIEGKVISEVVYKDQESVGKLNKEFEFKQEIAAEGTLPNMVCDASVVVNNITVTPEEKEDKTTFVYAVDMFAKALVFEENTYEVANDMFSLKNEIQTTYDYIESKIYKFTKNGAESVLSQTNISDIEDLEDVVGVFNSKLKVCSVQELEDKCLVSFEASAVAIYKTSESYDKKDVFEVFDVEIQKEEGLVFSDIEANSEIASFKVKAGKELEIAFKIEYFCKFAEKISQRFIKAYELKDEKEQNVYGIRVYVTKQGQTLFDVAKTLNVKPEIVLAQNQVEETFEQGEKIYVYSPINLA